MLTLSLAFPMVDPVLFELGPIKVHWYGVSYAAGLLGGIYYILYLLRHYPTTMLSQIFDGSILWVLFGIVIGGRLGHFIFYDPATFFYDPWEVLMVWRGGMSFHGGVLGVVLLTAYYAQRRHVSARALWDCYVTAAPIGLGLGRVANFINGELFGRITDSPWGVIFPRGGAFPRHATQLYEAFFEGIVLLILMNYLWKHTQLRHKPGMLTGVFAIYYACVRSLIEFVREPDYMIMGLTAGQVLCIPLAAVGVFFIYDAKKRTKHHGG